MLFILLGGALVTKTDSGMGCGRSWPLCNGQLIPDKITIELVIELSHRLVSGAGGFLVLILSYMSWKKIGHIREARFLSVLSFGFLLLQGLIGAAAVIWSQSDFVLALHFGISLISFAAVFLLTLLIFEVDKKFEAEKLIVDKRMKFHIIGVLIFCLVVVYTGALVRHTESMIVLHSPLTFMNGFRWDTVQSQAPFSFGYHMWLISQKNITKIKKCYMAVGWLHSFSYFYRLPLEPLSFSQGKTYISH
jgi:cytochrome c oxidase assembly protein subunit 15